MPKAPFLVATLPDHLAPGDLRLGGRGRVAVGERRVEDDRLLEETGRRLRCAEGPGALPGLPQGLRGPGQELLDVDRGRATVLDRLNEVVREHLRPVVGPVGRER